MLLYEITILALLFQKILSEKCVCVPIWRCQHENLQSSEDYNSNDSNPCEGDFDVCCPIKCGKRKREVFTPAMIRTRFLGASINKARFAEFPWMLAIIYEDTYRCGGSLIHPKAALTAAHCVQNPGVYKVRAGEWNWKSEKEKLKHQDRSIDKMILHPYYNPINMVNDIALLIVDSPFHLQDNVGTACLPSPHATPASNDCVVTGWGRTSPKESTHQAILNKATFPLVPHYFCEEALQSALLGSTFRLDPSFMCAGGRNRDACKGDGGSPLMCEVKGEKDTYEQFGIVSWGLTCGEFDAPGVYVNVARFVDWIDQQMALFGLESDFYKK